MKSNLSYDNLVARMYASVKAGDFLPTGVIVLGGTGIRVARNLKARLQTSGANVIPILAIDSDTRENEKYPELPPLDPTTEMVVLQPEVAVRALAKAQDRHPSQSHILEYIADYLRSAFEESPMQEAFYCVYLDRKNHPIGRHLVTLGTATSTLAAPREVFRGAILASASALVVAHNHPSGDPAPSAADVQITRQLREAAKVIDIDLMDHVIIGDPKADPHGVGHYSFRAAGIL